MDPGRSQPWRGRGAKGPRDKQGLLKGRLGDAFPEVFERARLGDRDALATMYRLYLPRISGVVRRRLPPALRSKYDTMDLAQSVFVDVMRGLPQILDQGERAFLGLLTMRVENKVRDKLRRHLGRSGRRAEERLGTGAEPPAAGAGDAGPDGVDEFDKLRRMLDAVDPREREILRLHAQGASFARIASELALVSADAVRKRHARTLAGLRERWTNDRR